MTDITTLDELIADLQARRTELPGNTPVRIAGSMKQTFRMTVSTGRLGKADSRSLAGRLLVSRGGEPVVLITRD